jgi:hypothetical protein
MRSCWFALAALCLVVWSHDAPIGNETGLLTLQKFDSLHSSLDVPARGVTNVVTDVALSGQGARMLGNGGTTLANINFATPYIGGAYYYQYSISGYSWTMAGNCGLTYCAGTGFTSGNACPPTGDTQVAFVQGCGYNSNCMYQAATFPAGDYTVSVYASARWNQGAPSVYISLNMQIATTGGTVYATVNIRPTSNGYVQFTTPVFTLLSSTAMQVNFIGAATSWSPGDQTIFLATVSVNNIATCVVPGANGGSTVTRTAATTWSYTCNAAYYGTSTTVTSNVAYAGCTYSGSAAVCSVVCPEIINTQLTGLWLSNVMYSAVHDWLLLYR